MDRRYPSSPSTLGELEEGSRCDLQSGRKVSETVLRQRSPNPFRQSLLHFSVVMYLVAILYVILMNPGVCGKNMGTCNTLDKYGRNGCRSDHVHPVPPHRHGLVVLDLRKFRHPQEEIGTTTLWCPIPASSQRRWGELGFTSSFMLTCSYPTLLHRSRFISLIPAKGVLSPFNASSFGSVLASWILSFLSTLLVRSGLEQLAPYVGARNGSSTCGAIKRDLNSRLVLLQ